MNKLFVAGVVCSLAGLPLACTIKSHDDSGGSGMGGEGDSAGRGGTGGSQAGSGGKSGSGGAAAGYGGNAGTSGGKAGGAGSANGGAAGTATAAGAGGDAGGDVNGGAAGDGESGGGGMAGAGDEPKATSGFDTSADGWTIKGDAQADSVEPDYAGVGGNPDGLISASDDVTGGTWYFNAPSKYLGDDSRFYGKKLKFDLKVTPITSPFAESDVLLEGGGLTVAFDCSPDPGTDWTTFTVPLSEAGWTLTNLDGEAVTAEQFRAVLADLTSLRIRGEFNNGADTGSLDNVSFGIE